MQAAAGGDGAGVQLLGATLSFRFGAGEKLLL